MIQKIKSFFINTHNACIPSFIVNDKRKKMIFCVAFYILLASTFLTVFGQIPFFSSRGLTKLFQFGWVLVLVPLLMLDYKQLIKSLLKTILLILPFILYCLIALCFNIKSIAYSGTEVILLSSFILFVGMTFAKYKTEAGLKVILFGYLVAAILYAGIVYLTVLRGYDLENPYYAFGDKNSAGPIFMFAAICAFYLFSKRNPVHLFLNLLIITVFVVVIALSKNRAVIIILPLIIIPMVIFEIKNKIASLIVIAVITISIILIFVVPQLYDTIVVKILFNNKTSIDEIFSGRLTQIIENIQNLKPVLGNGGKYFDCMPISFLCSYGILGIVSLIPILIAPYLMIFKCRKLVTKRFVQSAILLSVVFIANSLFEGYGYFGPGAKTFILWFTAGSLSFKINNSKIPLTLTNLKNRIKSIINHIQSNQVLLFFYIFLSTISLISILIGTTVFKIGDAVIDKIPNTNQISEYVKIQDNVIDAPINEMCVGQKITFKTNAMPYNAYDKLAYWSTGWIKEPNISVNGYTGVVTAIKTGYALLHLDRFRVGPNGIYIQFPIKDYSNYNFNKLYISTTPFTSSFSNTEDESISINNKCTAKLFYDSFYLPKNDDFSFVSSNENIASIDRNGIITAHSLGTCYVKGVINNSFGNESVNSIRINVVDEPYVPVSSFDVIYPNQWYQYEPYKLFPVFNEDASDKDVVINVDGLEYTQNGDILTFVEYGTVTITISSQNNPSFFKTIKLDVKENQPLKFECETNRILIGEKKNASELGLNIVYKNGYKKVLTDDDIYFNAFDFTNRAWTNQNGLVDGSRTTIYAVKKGTIKLDYISKIDQNIKATFYITCSAYTAEEYSYLCNGTGVIALSFVLLIALIFSLFVNIKRKWILFVSITATAGIFITISFLLYGISPFTVIPAIVNLIALITVILLRVILKNRFPLKFLEEPAEYTPTISYIKIDENITI